MQLREPACRPSAKAPILWTVGAFVGDVVLAGVIVAAQLWFGQWLVPTWGWVLFGAIAVGYAIVMPTLRYRTHRWETTEQAVYTQTGWLTRERRIAPIARVQTVDFEQGVLSRLLGLADVTVTTASAAGPLKIEALDKPTADRLIAELTARAGLETGDGT